MGGFLLETWNDSPPRCSPRHFAKFIHCQYLAGVAGMFPLDPALESRYVFHEIRGATAVQFIRTIASRQRARHTLGLESIPALLDFFLELLFAEHIRSVSFCHLFSLPQLGPRTKCSPGCCSGPYSPSERLRRAGRR